MNDKTKEVPSESVDLTEARRKRCEPVVEAILKMMLDRELLLGDRYYIEQMIKYHLGAMFQNLVVGFTNEAFNMLDESISQSIKIADANLWGKEADEITIADIDKAMKKEGDKK